MTTPSRAEFEAAAYRYIRDPKNWTQDFLIINDDHTKFTHSVELDAKLAAAMGWPTVPEVKP